MTRVRAVVLGAGIAGLGAAWAFARRGHAVVVVDAAARPADRATRVGAAIFRLAVPNPDDARWGVRSLELGRTLVPGGWVQSIGGWYPLQPARQSTILAAASEFGVRVAHPDDAPPAVTDVERPALFSPLDGVIDVPCMVDALLAQIQAAGGVVHTNHEVRDIDPASGRVETAHRSWTADVIVDALGAWAGGVSGLPGPAMQAFRRHLVVYRAPAGLLSRVAWDLDDEAYVRPHPRGVLACVCDETSFVPNPTVTVDETIVSRFHSRIEAWVPALAGAPMVELTAGLRAFCPDRRARVSIDAEHGRLIHVSGLGGHGLTAGVGAADEAVGAWLGEGVAPCAPRV